MPEVYNLIDANGNWTPLALEEWRLRSVDGLGMPEIGLLSERYAQQDGETYLGARLKKRIVTLNFQLIEDSEADLWDARDELIRIVSSFGTTGFVLHVTLPNGNSRFINLHFSDGLSMPRDLTQADIQQQCVLQCVAFDPLLYSPAQEVLTWNAAALGVPQTVNNPGNWKAYPVIVLIGQLDDPTVENTTTGEILDLTGLSLASGETVEITLEPGSKTIILDGTTNILNALSPASNLATWHLEPGDNSITFGGSNSDGVTQIILSYYPPYIGI